MLPKNPIYEFGNQNLMMVVVDGTIYHTENSGFPEKNYLSLCGTFFPLVKSETLRNIEKRYLRRNKKELEEFKAKYAEKISANKESLENLDEQLKQNKSLYFFLSQVIPIYIGEKIKERKKNDKQKKAIILENIVGKNFAVINRRIYPLKKIDSRSVIKVNGTNYFFDVSEKTIEKTEEEFQYYLRENLKEEVLEGIEELQKVKNKLLSLDSQVREFALKEHIAKVGACFEYGNIGYDPKNKRIYHFLPSHFNKTTKKFYTQKKGAIATNIDGSRLDTNFIIISRKNPKSDFKVDRTNLCLGMSPKGNSTKDVVAFLQKAAENIRWNGACYE